MKRLLAVSVLGLLVPLAPAGAWAACPSNTCTVDAVEYCCDQVVSSASQTFNFANMGACDTAGTPSSPGADGKCVLCIVSTGGSTVNGGNIDETICGGAGNDVIDGRGGADRIEGRDGNDTLTGGTGNDNLNGNAGDDLLFGSGGDDTMLDTDGDTFADGAGGEDLIITGGGDDEIYGGDDDDWVISGPGADYVDGGGGADQIQTIILQPPFGEQDAGGTFCGGAGNDNLAIYGGGHNCLDGGPGTDSCGFEFYVDRDQTIFDFGTAINCETASGVSTRTPYCGCD
jgi:hypothetical protein